jgi:membrane-associated phospholipid phosphatase
MLAQLLLIWPAILLIGISDIIVLISQGMSVDWALIWPMILVASALVVVSVICQWLRRYQVSRAVSAFAQIISIGILSSILSYALMAASPYPMADPLFMRADAAIGFDWLSWFSWVDSHPKVYLILRYAYESVRFQLLLVVIVLSYIDRDRVDEFFIYIIISLCITCVVMFFIPAIGAFSAHHVGVEPWKNDTIALRDHHLLIIKHLDGIITFPSFHTASGVLFIYIERHHKWLLYPLIIINVIMIASVLTEGAHYLVDVIGGLAVGFASLAITRSLLVWWAQKSVTLSFVKAAPRPG